MTEGSVSASSLSDADHTTLRHLHDAYEQGHRDSYHFLYQLRLQLPHLPISSRLTSLFQANRYVSLDRVVLAINEQLSLTQYGRSVNVHNDFPDRVTHQKSTLCWKSDQVSESLQWCSSRGNRDAVQPIRCTVDKGLRSSAVEEALNWNRERTTMIQNEFGSCKRMFGEKITSSIEPSGEFLVGSGTCLRDRPVRRIQFTHERPGLVQSRFTELMQHCHQRKQTIVAAPKFTPAGEWWHRNSAPIKRRNVSRFGHYGQLNSSLLRTIELTDAMMQQTQQHCHQHK